MAVLIGVEHLLRQLSVKSGNWKKVSLSWMCVCFCWAACHGFSMLIMGPMFEKLCSDSMTVTLMYVP